MNKVLLISFGEIFLKGKNRPFFLKKLKKLIVIAASCDETALVELSDNRFYIRDFSEQNLSKIIERVKKVFGVHSMSVALETSKDLASIEIACIEAAKEPAKNMPTFKVDTKRADKNYSMKSMEISAHLGGVLLDKFQQLKVDIHNPSFTVYVEVRQENAYIYCERIMGPGGMPVGSSGRAMLLLSGGIDSPVAAYMLAKRGLEIEAVHFFSPPYTSERAKQKVIDLAKIASEYCGPIKLHIVPFTKVQEEIYEKCHHELLTVIMRRFMMKIAENIAQMNKCSALATGESLGQVASQTLESLYATNSYVDMLVLRPLVCLDKLEIISIAEKINTYETSIQPFEDCCTVFTPRHPVTKPKIENLEKNEAKLDVEGLVKSALEETYTIECLPESK
ncbi:MAG: tRNA 4-thiouridine(8) synthase ThiI [Clostridia bacterium]|nr:tRNA 4-thiouridine(8) synthase ThiI [Clostridia bacterium]